METESIQTEPVDTNLPQLPNSVNSVAEQQNEQQEDGFTIPNFTGELLNTFLSIYCKFRPEIDKELFLLTDEEKAIVSKLLDPLLLKTLQKIGIKARDFEVLISLIIIAFPRAYSIYLVESRRAKQRKIAKQSVAEGDKIGKTAKTEDRPESQ